jgi:hypothetical protein
VGNLARPCGIFYENFISKIISKSLTILNSSYNQPYYELVLKDIQNCNYTKIIQDSCKDYFYELMLYLGLKPNCFPENKLKDVAITPLRIFNAHGNCYFSLMKRP